MAGNSSQHAWADFDIVVKGEYIIWPTDSL
jgi:hypothetical protein